VFGEGDQAVVCKEQVGWKREGCHGMQCRGLGFCWGVLLWRLQVIMNVMPWRARCSGGTGRWLRSPQAVYWHQMLRVDKTKTKLGKRGARGGGGGGGR
jgi:hypothetical protein